LTTSSAQTIRSAYYCRAVKAAVGKLNLNHHTRRLTNALSIDQSEVLSTMNDHGWSRPLSNVIGWVPFFVCSPIVDW
jgi:hypothetical protein